MRPIRKAVFPVAGLGTRFLPATKAMPKEMLPVVDRPLIQHVVDEAREAGIEHFIFVTGRNKGVIEDHFDRQFELEHTLTERKRNDDLEALSRDLPGPGTTSFTRQQLPLGLGHAVWCARELIGHEPFALLLPDVLVQHERSCLAQMIDAARGLPENPNIIAVEEVPADRVHMYGVVGIGKRQGKLFELTQMVEKPDRATAPSNLIITGRWSGLYTASQSGWFYWGTYAAVWIVPALALWLGIRGRDRDPSPASPCQDSIRAARQVRTRRDSRNCCIAW